jgi:hypothetical protein
VATYEFECRACNRMTLLELSPQDRLNLRAVTCAWCGSTKVILSAYYGNKNQIIDSLKDELGRLSAKVEALENGDDLSHDEPSMGDN